VRRQLALSDRLKLTFGLILIGGFGLLCRYAHAGDYHQNDSAHLVVYSVTDSTGQPVSGQTVRLTLWQPRTNRYFDWSDSTFKAIGSVTTLSQTMNENTTNNAYYYTISVDNGTIISGDVICTVSNESATYGDHQSEAIYFDRLEKIVRINR